MTPITDTATDADFEGEPIVLTWTGEEDEDPVQVVQFDIIDDDDPEGAESFSVELSSPTGGAIVGPRAVATLIIRPNDQPPAEPVSNNGGGGVISWLSLLMLAAARLFRLIDSPGARAAGAALRRVTAFRFSRADRDAGNRDWG